MASRKDAVVLQTEGGFDGSESRWLWRVNLGLR